MSLYDDLPNRPASQRVWAATIASTPTDQDKRVSVVIPGLDRTLRWEDCRWQPRGTADWPERGNQCVVVMDDNNEIWVVVWWPFNT
jgi:hypothetical protein